MANSQQLQTIDIQNLVPGMMITSVVKQNGPIKIKKSGLVTSVEMVQGLIEMGIQQVAIDPDQTVEFETTNTPNQTINQEIVNKSATQKMLQSNTLANSRIEDNLASQFHRSLFLPTVQDIPSAWQYFAKKCGLVAVMAFGGFGLGWSIANYQLFVSMFASKTVILQAAEPEASSNKLVESGKLIPSIKDVEMDTKTPDETKTVEVSLPQVKEVIPIQPQADPNDIDSSSKVTNSVPSESKTESPQVSQSTPQISNELLKKFNQAIAQVSESSQSELDTKTNSQDQNSLNQVPRVDQLPAWVMTELPSMSFSAHMYASNPNDRWLRVNGSKMVEGDVIQQKVKIISIEPQLVILNYSGHEFSMAALTDW
ncbi:general secretion pathway protein GspB [Paraglaciecola sp.]|uniref:general secretion pathway protein GspB n=1 Tax=Paraglaciecola sp. TaxID=1920173 RepID=UPI003EF6A611